MAGGTAATELLEAKRRINRGCFETLAAIWPAFSVEDVRDALYW